MKMFEIQIVLETFQTREKLQGREVELRESEAKQEKEKREWEKERRRKQEEREEVEKAATAKLEQEVERLANLQHSF